VLADRHGARGLATIGLIGCAASFLLLDALPMNFDYPTFAAVLLLFSLSAGLFMTPNQTAVMNSLPPEQRGAGAGMNATFMNSAQVLSIGIFFSIITLGLVSSLPGHLYQGLVTHGVPSDAAINASRLPPIGSLFAAFLGFNPVSTEIPPHVLASLGHAKASVLTGRSFFPALIAPSFADGLHLAFDFAAATTLLAAVASWLRGAKYVNRERAPLAEELGTGFFETGQIAAADVGAGVPIEDDSSLSHQA
jgi:MFS family permease